MPDDPTPTISVALCTYNGAAYLREQLDSIAAQSLPPSDIVLSDDASTDDTLAIAEAFAATTPCKLHIHRNDETIGATANFERAIALCGGEFIALADQDDVWLPDKLRRLHDAVVADARNGYAFCDATLIRADGREVGGKTLLARRFALRDIERRFAAGRELDLMLKRDFIYGTTLLFRARARELVLPIAASWSHDTWIVNVLAAFGYRGVPVLEPLVRYRQHGVQASGGIDDPRSTTYEQRVVAYDDLWAHLVSTRDRSGRALVPDVLDRIDDKQRYLRTLVQMREMPPHTRLAAAVREVATGRWSRYSPRTIFVDKRFDPGLLLRRR